LGADLEKVLRHPSLFQSWKVDDFDHPACGARNGSYVHSMTTRIILRNQDGVTHATWRKRSCITGCGACRGLRLKYKRDVIKARCNSAAS
jgi:hypothetical protein